MKKICYLLLIFLLTLVGCNNDEPTKPATYKISIKEGNYEIKNLADEALEGETVYFSDTIIIFTSNLGANEVQASTDKEGVAKEFIKIVKNYFDNELKRPELLGRIGYNNIVPFNFIQDREFQYKICKSKLRPVIRGIEEKYKLDLEFEKEMEAIDFILKVVDLSKGGRDILNAINDRLLDPLAMFLFKNKEDLRMMRGSKILVKLSKEGFNFEFV